ncbi:MAG: Fe-S cluster assembly ATPase SufC [Fibromonadaceae bacterium]|jgi:Fe-S cluster assembly ATP-binding protein|nr:Fe-S cluster assembly ATPase SufC [Fibromonadaceae bacterium]
MLEIKNLHASLADGTEILKGLNLSVGSGEIHAIMGPNGAGKSTLSKVIAGHPSYKVTSGSVDFLGKDLLSLSVAERANTGFFVGFQYPLEIAGLGNREFLRAALDAKCKALSLPKLGENEFNEKIKNAMQLLEMDSRYIERGLNEGFSGGEKKRNEILQMAILEPALAFLDETDSGLDIDALRIVANGISNLMNANRSVVLITHYQRLLDYVKPQFVHVLTDGKISQTGGSELALELEERGYGMADALLM